MTTACKPHPAHIPDRRVQRRNRLVYGLYGFTAEEIALVEAETKK